MKDFPGTFLLTASHLMRFVGCQQATSFDLQHLHGEGPGPIDAGEEAQILRTKGDEHEAAYLARLKAEGRHIVEMGRKPLAHAAAATREVLAQGPDIIFQGALHGGLWGGYSDFLERVEKPSALGAFSYEVADTKLKRTATPKHVLQLVVYSDLLAQIQGVQPEFGHVQLGNGERVSLRLTEFSAYSRRARARLETFVTQPWDTRPLPCPDCDLCHWSIRCEDVWLEEDSLFNVAGITRSQVLKLEAQGIRTMAELAVLDRKISKLADSTQAKITTQARLQHARKAGGEPTFVLRPPEPGRGFALLPEPQEGDLFYDIEGDPHYEDGLEYLHGLWFDGTFKAFWAHSHEEEKEALRGLLAFFEARLKAYPAACIYHYAPYEVTALRRLTVKYGVGEAFLDRLMRERRFVDLYSVVRGALICSERNYSIKSLEVFYGLERDGDVKTAGGSVVAYENWRETREQAILDGIEHYNRIDCISTEKLRDWLIKIRPEGPWPIVDEEDLAKAAKSTAEQDAEAQEIRDLANRAAHLLDGPDLLFNMGLFHRREAKPAWWAVLESINKDQDELIEDLDCMAGLEAVGPLKPVRKSMARQYSYPPQETKIRAGKKARVPTDGFPEELTVEAIDRTNRIITLVAGPSKTHLLADHLTLHPSGPINDDVIRKAVRAVMAELGQGPALTAANDLMSRCPPRLRGHLGGSILDGDDLVAGTISAVMRMEGTVLPIQGPPGTGKTYVTARAIMALLASDPDIRIAVAAPSHEAIKNLLLGCKAAMEELCPESRYGMVHMGCAKNDPYPDDEDHILRTPSNDDPRALSPQMRIVGGTVFFLSRPDVAKAYDWLFVDEAGQVGLANALAMTQATRNLVLVGDPRQLPQVVQGSHPGPAGLSCLEWMLDGHSTVPADRGIFLPISRRMHPDVCRFISEQVYEGRLESHPETARQKIVGSSLPEAGAHWMSVEHEGCAQVSYEEVREIITAARALLQGTWTERDGTSRPMSQADIIVVAPYNAQVIAIEEDLKAAGLDGIRVGTVDKFQGQEAPACLVSMTASSAEETSRGMEFLLSLNRINVAVSRAKGLALVFGAPRLLEARCETIEQMRLANTLCALAET